MKYMKRLICLFMLLAMLMGLTACSTKTFDQEMMVKFCSDRDFTEMDDPYDYWEEYGKVLYGIGSNSGVFVYCTGKDAQHVYDLVINQHDYYEKYDIEEASNFFYLDRYGFDYCSVLTFKDAEDAEDFFREYGRGYSDNAKEQETKGYRYMLRSEPSQRDKEVLFGIYLKGNTVLSVLGDTSDSEIIDDLCKSYGVISPTKS